MKFETSICINGNVKNEILKLSKQTGCSVCSLINLLIKKAISLNHTTMISNKLIEYQKSVPGIESSIFRYRMTYEEHKHYNMARCRLEISISKLLLVGFLIFFDKLVEKLIKDKQNNFKNSYTIIKILLLPTVECFLKSIDYTVKKE